MAAQASTSAAQSEPRRNDYSSASDSGSDASSSSGDEDEWLDQDEEQEEAPAIISLLDDHVFPDVVSMLNYCKDKGLDFLAIRDRLNLDFYGLIKLINFIRSKVHEGVPLPAEITAADLEDDRYLKPVLDDDALILCLDDLPESSGTGAEASAAGTQKGADAPAVDELIQKNAELQAQLEQLSKQFSNYRLAVQQTLDQRWQADDDDKDAAKGKAAAAAAAAAPSGPAPEGPAAKEGASDYYFESYAHNDIHETMLKDTVRTEAYRDFIYQNKDLFAGKVVLDIGCGTGILSMFCAKAGAKQVIAVDRSEIIDKARENIYANGLSDVIVTLKGRIEEVILPVEKVDIIVSEWMGYCLLYEAMLNSVLWARDKYLAPQGLLVPSHGNMWIAPVSEQEYIAEYVDFWRDVYGFDMKVMQKGIYEDCRMEVRPAETVCGTPASFGLLDFHTVKVEDLVFTAKWQSAFDDKAESHDGFLVWWDVFFARNRVDESIKLDTKAQEWVAETAGKGGDKDARVAFTTGPFGEPTHWRQGLMLLDKNKVKETKPAPGKKIAGEIEYITAENHERGLNLRVTWAAEGEKEQTQTWLLH
ncbi:S-adenosyl-L-methionine-dependent methyltransferase [Neurospora crassa]|uniref:type I protein arginine methyltransferase n=2 Tax=Neurospora crassa TaxID=5141 RepID=Q1K5I1_NEUCR|nr:S-adenosylmethionine-dependent methyltransferase superfamily domain-containing protein [Neurospora crassa OR74A]EAA27639.2 protein arginine methyltransferase RmtB [Neurospora crassa OR74A]KHE82670.1 S-adenosyl-L-methionine-dependent methyltransferase [Neurospora crassa]|eukprot:XP_956875.2 S-adenosylmethionine-dependent methyltransferase superfamily domain-containing protein [Neurospora crassa OR74A]